MKKVFINELKEKKIFNVMMDDDVHDYLEIVASLNGRSKKSATLLAAIKSKTGDVDVRTAVKALAKAEKRNMTGWMNKHLPELLKVPCASFPSLSKEHQVKLFECYRKLGNGPTWYFNAINYMKGGSGDLAWSMGFFKALDGLKKEMTWA